MNYWETGIVSTYELIVYVKHSFPTNLQVNYGCIFHNFKNRVLECAWYIKWCFSLHVYLQGAFNTRLLRRQSLIHSCINFFFFILISKPIFPLSFSNLFLSLSLLFPLEFSAKVQTFFSFQEFFFFFFPLFISVASFCYLLLRFFLSFFLSFFLFYIFQFCYLFPIFSHSFLPALYLFNPSFSFTHFLN